MITRYARAIGAALLLAVACSSEEEGGGDNGLATMAGAGAGSGGLGGQGGQSATGGASAVAGAAGAMVTSGAGGAGGTSAGNGTTVTGGTAYAHFHEHAASWGLISIASHNSNVGDGTFHAAALDYMLEQNEDSGSELFGKIAARTGTSGHSQGGAGADRCARMHASVAAIGNVQGSFGGMPPDAAYLCLTGTEDIATEGCKTSVQMASMPALYASYDGADHVSTTLFQGTGSDAYLRLYTGWFRCFLADDSAACEAFKGEESCPVCMESGWDEIFANNY